MSTNVINRALSVRRMVPADLARLTQIERPVMGTRGELHDVPFDLISGDRGVWVATVHNYVVGYLVFQLLPEYDPAAASVRSRATPAPGARKIACAPTLCVDLLRVFVAPDWRRHGIARAMLTRFDPTLRRQHGYRVQAAVPESNLGIQLTLRSVGYKAVRVLRGGRDEEDKYLMECRRS